MWRSTVLLAVAYLASNVIANGYTESEQPWMHLSDDMPSCASYCFSQRIKNDSCPDIDDVKCHCNDHLLEGTIECLSKRCDYNQELADSFKVAANVCSVRGAPVTIPTWTPISERVAKPTSDWRGMYMGRQPNYTPVEPTAIPARITIPMLNSVMVIPFPQETGNVITPVASAVLSLPVAMPIATAAPQLVATGSLAVVNGFSLASAISIDVLSSVSIPIAPVAPVLPTAISLAAVAPSVDISLGLSLANPLPSPSIATVEVALPVVVPVVAIQPAASDSSSTTSTPTTTVETSASSTSIIAPLIIDLVGALMSSSSTTYFSPPITTIVDALPAAASPAVPTVAVISGSFSYLTEQPGTLMIDGNMGASSPFVPAPIVQAPSGQAAPAAAPQVAPAQAQTPPVTQGASSPAPPSANPGRHPASSNSNRPYHPQQGAISAGYAGLSVGGAHPKGSGVMSPNMAMASWGEDDEEDYPSLENYYTQPAPAGAFRGARPPQAGSSSSYRGSRPSVGASSSYRGAYPAGGLSLPPHGTSPKYRPLPEDFDMDDYYDDGYGGDDSYGPPSSNIRAGGANGGAYGPAPSYGKTTGPKVFDGAASSMVVGNLWIVCVGAALFALF